jgi:uncharacterized ion transporter superfamily protein YfcC
MKMTKRKWKDIEQSIILLLFAFAIIAWLIWSIYQAFWMPEKPEKTIKFEVTGIINGTDAGTVVQVHYECIKYCSQHVSDGYMKDCWDQCTKLGKEVCEK